MCELLGMSANTPTDIAFSFTGLIQRSGLTGPHRDGWGIVFYQNKGIRDLRDVTPGYQSALAELVQCQPIKSETVIGHIREANAGRVCLENTHPFTRELWGRHWTFAHNGQLKGVKNQPLDIYRPVGTTDSEHAFCWLLNQIRARYPKPPKRSQSLWRFVRSRCDQLKAMGVFNMLLTDGRELVSYCSTKLCWITRQAPFTKATLKDTNTTVDFQQKNGPNDIVTIIATEPLTGNEQWNPMTPGELRVFRKGQLQ